MNKKKITLRDIAEKAGVSITTVSHVLNRTRYVKPDVRRRVEELLLETGYMKSTKDNDTIQKNKTKISVVAIFPNMESGIYRNIIISMRRYLGEKGYLFYVAISNESIEEEQHIIKASIENKMADGLFLVPSSSNPADYSQLLNSGFPFICLERPILDAGVDLVMFEDLQSVYVATEYLLKSGHWNILYIRESTDSLVGEERTRGFLRALRDYDVRVGDANIAEVDLKQSEEACKSVIRKAYYKNRVTAIVVGGNRLTRLVLAAIRDLGLDCPEDISIVGFGDEPWGELANPPLTTVERDADRLSMLAVEMLGRKINKEKIPDDEKLAPVHLNIRKSTKMLDNGPMGEHPVSTDSIALTQEERRFLERKQYNVAVSFHYTGTAWTELHEKGIRDELSKYGIKVISVMDAHFDPELQKKQLDAIKIQKPDAVIAIPADDVVTADKFRELSERTKLIFISNVPTNMEKNAYVSCVSVNEWENGTNAGRLLREYFKKEKGTKVGMIVHGADFYGTHIRDAAAEKAITEHDSPIEIVSMRGFGKIEHTYEVCKNMIEAHPEIKGLYISWDRPALYAIKALEELGRTDIVIFTTDLDYAIAKEMQKGTVMGLSTQRPYEQGRAAALVVAKSLVSDKMPKYVGVQPYIVTKEQLLHCWKEIFHELPPEDLR